jgi:hypothetical protein
MTSDDDVETMVRELIGGRADLAQEAGQCRLLTAKRKHLLGLSFTDFDFPS